MADDGVLVALVRAALCEYAEGASELLDAFTDICDGKPAVAAIVAAIALVHMVAGEGGFGVDVARFLLDTPLPDTWSRRVQVGPKFDA